MTTFEDYPLGKAFGLGIKEERAKELCDKLNALDLRCAICLRVMRVEDPVGTGYGPIYRCDNRNCPQHDCVEGIVCAMPFTELYQKICFDLNERAAKTGIL